MELQLPSFPVLLTFLVFIFLVSRIIGKKNSAKNLPPGPWKLPLIGSIHHLITSLPHHRLKDLAKIYGPIMHLQLGELSNIVISAPQTAKEVLKTHDITFAQRPFLLAASVATYNYSNISFAPYGDYWRQMRKICTVELLTAKRVDSFRSVREEQVSKLITSVSSSAGSPTAKALIEAAGGFSLADLYPSVKLLQVVSGMNSRLQSLQKKVDKIFQSIIDEHRAGKATGSNQAEGNEDLVDVLLYLQDQGDLQFPPPVAS